MSNNTGRTTPLRLATLAAALVLGLTGCGGGEPRTQAGNETRDTLAPQAALAAAVQQAEQMTTSRFSLTTTSTIDGTPIEFSGEGVFDYVESTGEMSFSLPGGAGELRQLVVDDSLYLGLPTEPGVFYQLRLSDLVDTSLDQSTDPSAGLQALRGANDDVVEVGRETVRDAETTRYRGTLDIGQALEVLKGPLRELIATTLETSDLQDAPFDAWIDDEGRLRRMEQTLTLANPQQPDQSITVDTRFELYDYGVDVDVTAPPADQVKDGAPLLEAFKAAIPTS